MKFTFSTSHVCQQLLLAISVMVDSLIVMGMLITMLVAQARSIGLNRTRVEEVVIDKAIRRRMCHMNTLQPFVFPYDLGWRANFKLVSHRMCETYFFLLSSLVVSGR